MINYPRAFDVVVADELYAKSNFFNVILEHKKDVMAVLKDDRRDILKDVDGFFTGKAPTYVFHHNGTEIKCWDASGFLSWPQVKEPVRVIRTQETKAPVCRQLDGKLHDQPVSSWTWVTTLSTLRAPTQTAVAIGHARWNIDNNGFNESANHYFSDHVYRPEPTAMLNFWLLCIMAYNFFHCFYLRNLKPAVRAAFTMLHVSRQVQAELYCCSGLIEQPP